MEVDKRFVCQSAGVALLVLALVLHIVCLATPHYARVEDLHSPENSMHFGMWKICMNSGSKCVNWGRKTIQDTDGRPETIECDAWMFAVQAMSILGMIFHVFAAVTAVVHVLVKSRGDRLRLLPVFILYLCGVAALFILIGEAIMAAKFKTALGPLNLEVPFEIHLLWGFWLDWVPVVLTVIAGQVFYAGHVMENTPGGLV